jgi:lipoprotein-anchoring transpeptidase ErfK/SrfK
MALLLLAGCAAPPPAAPPHDTLTAVIDISEQSLVVTRSWAAAHRVMRWTTPVSTGRPGFATPLGSFHPTLLDRDHASTLYESAPMPWSVFFDRGVAIHGTYEQTLLGRPVSHGCVRVHPAFAEVFFKMVLEVGRAHTTITVQE